VEGVRHLAELGVVFLLFNIGLELSLERLQSMQKLVFGLGAGQVPVNPSLNPDPDTLTSTSDLSLTSPAERNMIPPAVWVIARASQAGKAV